MPLRGTLIILFLVAVVWFEIAMRLIDNPSEQATVLTGAFATGTAAWVLIFK